MNDPYQLLGVTRDTPDEEITRAYKTLARKYHPDLNPGDLTAEQKMKEINAAYDTIQAIRSGRLDDPTLEPEAPQTEDSASTDDTPPWDEEEPQAKEEEAEVDTPYTRNMYRLALIGIILLIWLVPTVISWLFHSCSAK